MPDGRSVPIDLIAINAAKAHLRQTMRYLNPDRHCVIDCYAGRGAGELVRTVADVTANDTSVGVAHWPLSLLETAVRLAQVFILSQIGQPLDQPFIATAMVQPTGENLDQHTIREVEMVMDDCLNQINRLREKIIDGEIPLY